MEAVILNKLVTGPLFFFGLKRSIVGNYPEVDRALVFRTVSELLSSGRVRFTHSGALELC
jgi:hypothetical protein